MKLRESLKQLIVEVASVESIVDCIKKRQKCVIYYDGDELGRGTGIFLDVYNQQAGTSTDVVERKNEIKINKFNSVKPYPNFPL